MSPEGDEDSGRERPIAAGVYRQAWDSDSIWGQTREALAGRAKGYWVRIARRQAGATRSRSRDRDDTVFRFASLRDGQFNFAGQKDGDSENAL